MDLEFLQRVCTADMLGMFPAAERAFRDQTQYTQQPFTGQCLAPRKFRQPKVKHINDPEGLIRSLYSTRSQSCGGGGRKYRLPTTHKQVAQQ